MSLIDKAYFTLEELEERWQLPHRDLVYLAENGQLRLSVRLFGVALEFGVYEDVSESERFTVPYERLRFTGFQDLLECDVFQVFRQGQVEVTHFKTPDKEYCLLIEPTSTVSVCRDDLLVRREERDRVEAQRDLVQKGLIAPPPMQQSNDYRELRTAGLSFHLGPVQARVVKRLHEAAASSNPWCDGKLVLGEAGSASTRMADVFKSQPHWRRLIDSDGRGRYRLRVSQR
jgi:hypothetical protein